MIKLGKEAIDFQSKKYEDVLGKEEERARRYKRKYEEEKQKTRELQRDLHKARSAAGRLKVKEQNNNMAAEMLQEDVVVHNRYYH